MAQVLSWLGPGRFGITNFIVDQNGNVLNSVGHEVGTGTYAPGVGGVGGAVVSSSIINTGYTYNPDFVSKALSSPNGTLVKSATQVYYYTFVDQAGYAPAGGGAAGWRPQPFDQNYDSKRSTVDEDDFDQYRRLITTRAANYLANSDVSRAARLPFIYPNAFRNVLTRRSLLEYGELSTQPGGTQQEATGNEFLFYKFPFDPVVMDQVYASAYAAATTTMGANFLNSGVPINPPSQWLDTTWEEENPNGSGSYYPFKPLYTTNATAGGNNYVRWNVSITWKWNLIPAVAAYRGDPDGYWFGALAPGGPEDNLSFSNIWPGQTILNRRDPLYLGIRPGGFNSNANPANAPYAKTDMSMGELIQFMTRGNNGGRYLPTRHPERDITVRSGNSNFTYSVVPPNVDPLSVAPYASVSATIIVPPGTIGYTKGTYSHIEVPEVYTKGDIYTPSAVICHNAKKIYYMYYTHQDNKRTIAYNVLADCEEDEPKIYTENPPPVIPPPAVPPSHPQGISGNVSGLNPGIAVQVGGLNAPSSGN